MKKTNALNLSDVLAGYYKPTPGSMAYSLTIMTNLIGPGPHHIVNDPLLIHRVDDALEKAMEATNLTSEFDADQHIQRIQQVKIATALALEAFALVVMTVWSTFPEHTDREMRNTLLAPINEQNGRFRLHYSCRKTHPTVDAKTGEFTVIEETNHKEDAGPERYPHLPGGIPHEQYESDGQQPGA